MAWFKPVKMSVPVLPDGLGMYSPDMYRPDVDRPDMHSPDMHSPDTDRPKESPKATFGIEEIGGRPSPKTQAGFTVHASRNGETSQTHRTSPTVTVAKARVLFKTGWSVHIADSAGRQYAPSEFDEILKFDRQ
jgi:hypothetical protein